MRTFTSEALAEPVEWTGKVKAEIHVSSSAPDTDIIVRVSDVYPDGRSILLMDYIRRARYRDGYEREVPLEPGKVATLAFDVGWTSQIFNRGHRIRITLASTGAPFYEPNPNTGEPLTLDPPDKTVVAKNTVFHDRRHASRILAPVRPRDRSGEDRRRISEGLDELKDRLAKLRTAGKTGRDHLADAEVFSKGIDWAFRHEKTLSPADLTLLAEALERGRNRVADNRERQAALGRKNGVASSAASSPRLTARCSPTS